MIRQFLPGKTANKAKLASAVAAAMLLSACGTPPGTSSSTGVSSSTGTSVSSRSSAPNGGSSSSASNVSKTPFPHSNNVFAAVNNWYVNDWWSKNAIAEGGKEIAKHNTGVWMDRIGAIERFAVGEVDVEDLRNISQGPNDDFGLRQHLEAAEAQGNALFHFVSYDLPGRDCAAEASNGELPANNEGMEAYKKHYVDRIYNILKEFPHIPVVAIIEIDSLPNLVTNSQDERCQLVNNDKSYGYVNGVRYSINKYSQLDNVHIYVDAGHSGWLGWDDDLRLASLFLHGTLEGFEGMEQEAQEIGDEIEAAEGSTGKYTNIGPAFAEPPDFPGGGTEPPGYDKIDGFITNTSNYTPLEEPFLGDPREPDGAAPLRSHYFYDWNPRFDEWTFTEDWLDALQEHGGNVSGLGMLIDTGRNGWGQAQKQLQGSSKNQDPEAVNDYRIDQREHRGNWCNQPGGVGKRPQASPDGKSWIDAYVWTKPQGESDGISDPNFTPDPNDPKKKHDPMCDPSKESVFAAKAESTDALDLKTGSLDNAPHAGRWFSEAFQTLYDNAWPEICDGKGDDC